VRGFKAGAPGELDSEDASPAEAPVLTLIVVLESGIIATPWAQAQDFTGPHNFAGDPPLVSLLKVIFYEDVFKV
jgi:hypothetical protein